MLEDRLKTSSSSSTTTTVCDLDLDLSGWSDHDIHIFAVNGIDHPQELPRQYQTFLRHVTLARCPSVLAFHINRNVFVNDAMVKLDASLSYDLTLPLQNLIQLDNDRDGRHRRSDHDDDYIAFVRATVLSIDTIYIYIYIDKCVCVCV